MHCVSIASPFHGGVTDQPSLLAKLSCDWASQKLFPWNRLPGKLAGSGVVCHNFPDSVPFPGEDRPDRPRSKAGSKGIADLSLAECSTLMGAFTMKPKDGGLHFEQNAKLIGAYCS